MPSIEALKYGLTGLAALFGFWAAAKVKAQGQALTEPGMRRRTVSLRFLGPDVVYDGRPRDEKGAQEGNDAALSGMYAGLRHGDPFRTGSLWAK